MMPPEPARRRVRWRQTAGSHATRRRVPPARRHGRGGQGGVASTSPRARPWRSWAKAAPGKSVTALSVMQLLPYPVAVHTPGSSIRYRGRGAGGRRREDAARGAGQSHRDDLPGADDLAQSAAPRSKSRSREVLMLHKGLSRQAARERVLELLGPGRHPAIREQRLNAYPASALRRPAPARDDRHGARQRARPADRRRADHRARRHRPGADPEAAEGSAGAARHGAAADHPRPRHRAQHGRPRVRDDRRASRRDRAGRAGVRRPAARLHAAPARRPSPRAVRRRRTPTRRVMRRPTTSRSGSRSSAACCGAPSTMSRRSTASRSTVREGHTLGVVGESGSGKTTLGLALLRLDR